MSRGANRAMCHHVHLLAIHVRVDEASLWACQAPGGHTLGPRLWRHEGCYCGSDACLLTGQEVCCQCLTLAACESRPAPGGPYDPAAARTLRDVACRLASQGPFSQALHVPAAVVIDTARRTCKLTTRTSMKETFRHSHVRGAKVAVLTHRLSLYADLTIAMLHTTEVLLRWGSGRSCQSASVLAHAARVHVHPCNASMLSVSRSLAPDALFELSRSTCYVRKIDALLH
jgi:hypothetical protein